VTRPLGVKGRAVLCVALAAAACGPRGPVAKDPAKRAARPSPQASKSLAPTTSPPRPVIVSVAPAPAPPPTPPAEKTRPRREPPSFLLVPPLWLRDLGSLPDDVELVDVRPPRARRAPGTAWVPARKVPPPAPPPPGPPPAFIPRAQRPTMATGALTLAEHAFARGDAFDAAAQLRPLLATASPEARPYLEIQLCRAYVALSRLDDAEAILRRAIDRGTPQSWPAVFELATLLVRDRGADPFTTWQELAPLVDPLRTDLGRHLMQFTTSADALARLSTYAPPPPPPAPPARSPPWPVPPPVSCVDELAAFEANPPDKLPSWRLCPVQVSRLGRTPRSAAARAQLRGIADAVSGWQVALRSNFPDEERWLREAHQLARVVDLAPHEPGARVASWLALLAYQNAARFAAHRGEPWTVTRAYAEYAQQHVERMHPEFRDDILRVAGSFMKVAP
jgi:hypothetical protein